MSDLSLSALPPAVAIHTAAAIGAVLLGPVALWARKRSRGHRAAGYAGITLMLATALSALFIRDFRLPNVAGYTVIHLLVPVTIGGIALALWHISRRNVRAHRRAILFTYSGLVIAGVFALLPSRRLGLLMWHDWLGWV